MIEMFPNCTLLWSPDFFAIISNPVMNISMQRTLCFFQIISLETEFLGTELLVEGEGHFKLFFVTLCLVVF